MPTPKNTAYQLPHGDVSTAMSKFFQELGGAGKTVVTKIKKDPVYTRRLANFAKTGVYSLSSDLKLARAILANNFFGIEDWTTLYSVNFSNEQLRMVAEFPWGEDTLNAPCPFHKGKLIRETHFAFLGLDRYISKPLTIMQWQEMHPATNQPRFSSYPQEEKWKCWFQEETFANEPTCTFRWYLSLLEIVPGSLKKKYEDQIKLLPAEYEVPFAIEEVTKELLCFRKNSAHFNNTSAIRAGNCQDVSADGGRVFVCYNGFGVEISMHYDEYGNETFGIAASRKLPQYV